MSGAASVPVRVLPVPGASFSLQLPCKLLSVLSLAFWTRLLHFCLPSPPHPGLQPGLTGFFAQHAPSPSSLSPHFLKSTHWSLHTHKSRLLGSLSVHQLTSGAQFCLTPAVPLAKHRVGAELGYDIGQVPASALSVLSRSLWTVETAQPVSKAVQELELKKGTAVSPSENWVPLLIWVLNSHFWKEVELGPHPAHANVGNLGWLSW